MLWILILLNVQSIILTLVQFSVISQNADCSKNNQEWLL